MPWGNESSTARGYGHAWRKLRLQAMRRDQWLCQPCQAKGRVTPATECDHVIPKADGGTDTLNNVQGICTPCHKAKTELEAAQAQGRRIKPRMGNDGWPV